MKPRNYRFMNLFSSEFKSSKIFAPKATKYDRREYSLIPIKISSVYSKVPSSDRILETCIIDLSKMKYWRYREFSNMSFPLFIKNFYL